MAVILRIAVATRGLVMAFLTCTSIVLFALLPILSTACVTRIGINSGASRLLKHEFTFSRLLSDSSPIGSAEANARWFKLMRGMIRCFEMTSAENLYPRKFVSHFHLNVSNSSSKAKSSEYQRQRHIPFGFWSGITYRIIWIYNLEDNIRKNSECMRTSQEIWYILPPRFLWFRITCVRRTFFAIAIAPSTCKFSSIQHY